MRIDTGAQVMARNWITAIAAIVALGLVATAPARAQDRIYDPSRGGWITYDASKLERKAATRQGGVSKKYERQIVGYRTQEKPGTVIVDTNNKFLYYVLPRGKAVRYGVGVGRAGFAWAGETTIGRKAEWPTWTPTPDMIGRDPKLKKYAGGMPGGIKNPLGARALYLYEGSQDSLYRIHGTNEPWSIGRNISSGCIRMKNEDVTDLYGRVSIGTKVVVTNKSGLFSSL